MAARKKKAKAPMTEKRALLQVFNLLTDIYGGDGWDDWTEAEVIQAMQGWVRLPHYDDWSEWNAQEITDELVEQGFDPRDVRP